MFSQSRSIVNRFRFYNVICANRLTLNLDLQRINTKYVERLISSKSYYNISNALNSEILQINLATNLFPESSAFSTDSSNEILQDSVVFETVCEETLESLCEFFDDLVEARPELKTSDVTFSDGVLTVNLGSTYGTYVINRQSPNCQIWLSSPTSGPKRYDYIPSRKSWVYRHEPERSLHELLQSELETIVQSTISLSDCAHCGLLKN